MRAELLLATALIAGCTGIIGSGDGEPGAPGPGGGPGTTPTPASAEPRTVPLRPLTAHEIATTLRDLFGDKATEVAALQPAKLKAPNETMVSADSVWTGTRADLLEDALYRVATRLSSGFNCGDDACVEKTLMRELPRIFRRPLLDSELARYTTLTLSLNEKLGRADAFARGLEAALLSPEFLYLTSIGEKGTLTSLELASRLSYFIWSSAPDDTLREIAAKGELEANLEREVRRMLADPRAARGIARFMRNWTGTINLAGAPRSDPAWTAELATDALTETDRYVDAWFLGEKRTLETLLRSDSTYVSPALASFYGVTAAGDGFHKVALPEGRVGLFTQASFLATHATESASSPTYRGKWFMERALCISIGSPPPDAQAMAPKFEADMQTRDWHEALQNTKGCNGCHSLMEPPGYVYEGFDSIGRARTMEKGKPVRTHSTLMTGTDMDATYTGAADFAAAAGKSATVRKCFSTHFISYALGRDLNAADEALAVSVATAMSTDVREAIVALTTSPNFKRTH